MSVKGIRQKKGEGQKTKITAQNQLLEENGRHDENDEEEKETYHSFVRLHNSVLRRNAEISGVRFDDLPLEAERREKDEVFKKKYTKK